MIPIAVPIENKLFLEWRYLFRYIERLSMHSNEVYRHLYMGYKSYYCGSGRFAFAFFIYVNTADYYYYYF